jgi:hypothetical protein
MFITKSHVARFSWISGPVARIPSACLTPRVSAEHKGAFEDTFLSVHGPPNRYKPVSSLQMSISALVDLLMGKFPLLVIFIFPSGLMRTCTKRQASSVITHTWLRSKDTRILKFYWSKPSSDSGFVLIVPPCQLILLGFPLAHSQTQIVKRLYSKPKPLRPLGQPIPPRHHTIWSHELIAPLTMSMFPVPPPSCP